MSDIKVEFRCVGKQKSKQGVITAYMLETRQGAKKIVEADNLKDMIRKGYVTVVNLKLTKDGRLITKTNPKNIAHILINGTVVEINLDRLLKDINKEYDFLYKNKDRVAGYYEALTWGDNFLQDKANALFIQKLVAARRDMFSSDREVVALAFALEAHMPDELYVKYR